MPPTKHVEHDSKSGLTYKESQVKVRSMLPDWIDKTTGCNREIKRFRNKGRGVPSLEAMATRCLLLNAKELRLDTFENVPWVLGKKIWEEFRKHHLDSFRVWQIFANAYSKEKHPHIQYRKLIFNPWERFFLIPQSLNPPYFNGLTYLTITSGDLTPADLSLLPQLANLAVLSMSGGATKVNDIYIQTWHNEVIENSAFPKLRVLYFAHQPRVTVNSLPLLAAFPMLKACHMTGASFVDTTDEELSGTGWQRKGRDEFSAQLDKYCHKRKLSYECPAHQYFQFTGRYLEKDSKIADNDLPVLDVRAEERSFEWIDLKNAVWFERNELPAPSRSRHDSAVASEDELRPLKRAAEDEGPSAKRMKLRPGKKQSMNDLLSSFKMSQ